VGIGRWQYSPPECRTSADGWVLCRDRDGYWQRDHYDPDFGSGQAYGGGYGYDVLPPYAIARNLQRNSFTYISQPVLAGQFYQVKALDPYGRKVKIYVDAYSGRIAKVK
jgi:hypothetical protein